MGDRPHAVALLRSMFDDAAAALEVLTPPAARDTTNYRASRASRSSVASTRSTLRTASGPSATSRPSDVATQLRAAEQSWRALVDELAKALPAPVLTRRPGAPPTPPPDADGRHLTLP